MREHVIQPREPGSHGSINSCATQPDNSFSYLFEGRVTMSFNHFSTSLEVYSCVQLHTLVTHFFADSVCKSSK
jgi:hypothetical protein